MLARYLLKYFSRLKFPWLFAVTGALFGLDLLLPDFLPFADELLLGLMTLLLGTWKARKTEAKSEQAKVIDVEKVRPA
jgi:hypothetical protein